MNNILKYNLNTIISILPEYLSYKYLFYLYMSSKTLYNYRLCEKTLDNIYFTPRTYNKLVKAVNLWNTDRNKCIIKYNHISRWNTLYINSTIFLFFNNPNFNDNIDDWILYNVKDCRYMFYSKNKTNQTIFKKYLKKISK